MKMGNVPAMPVVFVVLLLLVDFPLISSTNSSGGIGGSEISWNDDVLGLLVFKAGMRDPTAALASWNEDDATPCNWTGVQCGRWSGRVESLVLENASLSGQIGRGLLKLDHLRALSLAGNNFSGAIEPDFLGVLESLDLSANRISGNISASAIGPSMRHLDLSGNDISGPIPASFFAQCGPLLHFAVARNAFEGTIPGTIGACSQLLVLDVSGNHFSGEPPSEIAGMAHLRVLDVSRNAFNGSVHLDVTLPWLVTMNLSGNHFIGSVTGRLLGTSTSLKYLDLSGNHFQGNLPEGIQNLTNLVTLGLAGNAFQGALPDWLGARFPNLQELRLSGNAFSGEIPATMGDLTSLRVLDIAGNRLFGGVPRGILQLEKLAFLDAARNELSGELPGELFSMASLQFLNLSANNFSGRLPISTAMSLDPTAMSSDPATTPSDPATTSVDPIATSPVRTAMPTCSPTLQTVDISDNQLSLKIPDELSQCSGIEHLNLGGNLLMHGIPWGIAHLKGLKVLDLSRNHLGGVIPRSMANLTSLKVLRLRSNWLGGPIPRELAKCEQLTLLDLSANRLNGSIPDELSKMKELQFLDLSWNNFSGSIPKGGIFELNNRTFLGGNSHLCGTAVNVACPMVPKPIVLNPNASENAAGIMEPGGHPGRNRIVLSVSAIIAISAAAVIALGIVIVSVLNIRAQAALTKTEFEAVAAGSSSSPCSSQSEDFAIGKLVMFTDDSGDSASKSSEELLPSAHALLNKEREIGRGSFGVVYKATLKNGQTFAVKKLLVPGLARSQIDFEKEVQQLGKIQHPNLVSLQGYYWTSKMQLLINDYLPNGNLYSRLHERIYGEPPLTWDERFHIALGTAKGLAHLHHGLHPQVVHYDLKSNNILLTESNRAQISDYGLGNLLPVMDRFSINSKFQGSLGYMAPELACESLKVTEKVDVYGFGVILLELVTGRRPVEYMEDDVVILCDFVRSRLESGRAMNCVDPSMDRHFPEEEVLPVVKLGLICTSQVPFNRPSMAEVVQILELVKPRLMTTTTSVDRSID